MEHLRQLVANIALAQDATAVGPNEINPDRLKALKRKADEIWDEDAKKYDMLHMQFQQHGTVRYNGGSWEVVERSEDGTKLTIKKGDNVPVVIRTPNGFANSLKTNVETYNNTNNPALKKHIAHETYYLINPPYKNPVYWTWLHRGDAYGLDATKAEAQKRTKAALLALQNNLFGYSETNTTFTEDFKFRFMPAWTGNAFAGGPQYDPKQEAGNLSQRYEIVTAIILGLGALLKFEPDAKKPGIINTRKKFQKEQTLLDSKLSSRARDVQQLHPFVQQYKSLHRRGELKGRIKHLERALELSVISIETQRAHTTKCYKALNETGEEETTLLKRKQTFEGAMKRYDKLCRQQTTIRDELEKLEKIKVGIKLESDSLHEWKVRATKNAKAGADAEAKARTEAAAKAKANAKKAEAEARKAWKITDIKESVQMPPNMCIIDAHPYLKRTYIRYPDDSADAQERRKASDSQRTDDFVAKMKTIVSRIPASIMEVANAKDSKMLNLLRVFMVYAINWYEDSSEPLPQKGVQLNAALGNISKILTGCTARVCQELKDTLRREITTKTQGNNKFPFFKITKRIKEKDNPKVTLSIVDPNQLTKLGGKLKVGQITGINASGKTQTVELADYNVVGNGKGEDYIRFLGVAEKPGSIEMPKNARDAIKAWYHTYPLAINALIRSFAASGTKRNAADAGGGGPAKR